MDKHAELALTESSDARIKLAGSRGRTDARHQRDGSCRHCPDQDPPTIGRRQVGLRLVAIARHWRTPFFTVRQRAQNRARTPSVNCLPFSNHARARPKLFTCFCALLRMFSKSNERVANFVTS